MKVKFKHEEKEFNFVIGDDITVVEDYLFVSDAEDEKVHRGTLTKIEESGFWMKLDGESSEEEFFYFLDIENVLPGDRIPMFGGSTKRLKKDLL